MFLMIWEVPKHQKPWFHTGFIMFFASHKIINLEAFKTVKNLDLSGGTFLHWCNAFLMILMIWEVPKHQKPWFHTGFITFFAFIKIINLEAFKTVENLGLWQSVFLHWCNAFLMILMIWEVPKHQKPWFHIGFNTFLAFLKIIKHPIFVSQRCIALRVCVPSVVATHRSCCATAVATQRSCVTHAFESQRLCRPCVANAVTTQRLCRQCVANALAT